MSDTLMTFGGQSFAGKIKSGGPISIARDALGNIGVSIKIPNYERMEFTVEDLERIADLLEAEPPKGANPADVMERSRSYAEDGLMSFRLSDTPRSRTLEVTPADREETSALFREISRRLAGYIASLEEPEEPEKVE